MKSKPLIIQGERGAIVDFVKYLKNFKTSEKNGKIHINLPTENCFDKLENKIDSVNELLEFINKSINIFKTCNIWEMESQAKKLVKKYKSI